MTRAIVVYKGARAMQPKLMRWRYGATTAVTRYSKQQAPYLSTYNKLQMMNWAARRIGRAYRKYSRRKRVARNVGFPKRSSTAKRTVEDSNATESSTSRSDRLLYDFRLTLPNKGDNIDQSERRMFNLTGFKVCMEISAAEQLLSGGPRTDQFCYINVALVSNKKDPQNTVGPSGINNHFFRANGVNRAQDFDTVSRSIDFSCRPINSDNWNVHMHKRLRIGGIDTGRGNQVVRVMEWVPIGRQIRENDDEEFGANFFVCYWGALAAQDTVTPFANMFRAQWHVTTYFRDIKP